MKHLLHNPAFKMACDQFDAVADFINMPESLRERSRRPSASSPFRCRCGWIPAK